MFPYVILPLLPVITLLYITLLHGIAVWTQIMYFIKQHNNILQVKPRSLDFLCPQELRVQRMLYLCEKVEARMLQRRQKKWYALYMYKLYITCIRNACHLQYTGADLEVSRIN